MKIKIDLENCYGIKKLEAEFDFSKKNTFVIYAPNGVMKTSFAKTFRDLSRNKGSKDLVFPKRKTKREIQDEARQDLKPEEIFVIEPYNEAFNTDKLSTLLVKKELKTQYDKVHRLINEAKENFMKELKKLSGLANRRDSIQEEIEKSFGGDFFDILEKIEKQVKNNTSTEFSNIIYNQIFNDKVLAFLNTQDFKKQIKIYIEKYNEIIEKSTYLKKDFNHYHATTVQKNLKDNGFFKANHSVNLFDGSSKQEIIDPEKFEELIKQEKEKVLNNDELKNEFEIIDKKLSNVDLRNFRDYLFDNKNILSELEDLEKFRKKLWLTYFTEQKELYKKLIDEYKKGKVEIVEIVKEAKKEKTDWEKAVENFNNRFINLPFKLKIGNKDDVILKTTTPHIQFTFYDLEEERDIEKKDLLKVLSQGEKRALYILNIIFEVEVRKKEKQKTLFIIDDIADSFDYKNKYAIIEYLKEISEEDNFYQIILTHNFDFFRTIRGRILGNKKWDNSFIAQSCDNKITLTRADKNINNPFSKWKENLNKDFKALIPSIPFIRNLIEFKDGNKSKEYCTLTYILHKKNEEKKDDDENILSKKTDDILISDLENIFKDVIKNVNFEYSEKDKNKKVICVIFKEADKIVIDTAVDPIDIGNKIILAIAIRLKAEEKMWSEVANTDEIKRSQTGKLFQRYKDEFVTDKNKKDTLQILESVNIMTPGNIHLNSFMYEPILDMGIDELKALYKRVKSLNS